MAQNYGADPDNLSIGGQAAMPMGGENESSPESSFNGGMLRVINREDVDEFREGEGGGGDGGDGEQREQALKSLSYFIQQQWSEFRRVRETRGISDRLLDSLRSFRGQYKPSKLSHIREFGGSEVYARITSLKCRGATAMLRDLYLSGERPWFIQPTPKPDLPDNIYNSLTQLIQTETQHLQQAGQPVTEDMVMGRMKQLQHAAERAAKKQAHQEAKKSQTYVEDLLVEGDFYEAMADFLHNITVFPFAFIKGPVVHMAEELVWEDGRATLTERPRMFWYAPSPFDVYWQSGVGQFANSAVIEHVRYTRAQLNALIGLPGYDEEALRAVLNEYDGGRRDWLDMTDSERAVLEQREDPQHNYSSLIDALEWHGPVKGSYLIDYGFTKESIPDPDRDYHVTAWLIGQHVIKAHLTPNPNKRHPFYMTSFEKVPGAVVGHGLPEILEDIQDVMNACLRSLVNNMAIASGPQVGLNEDRISPTMDSDMLYPWKRWRYTSDPMGSREPPLSFWQPDSRAQELLAVYEKLGFMADEISAIPRYITGNERIGGAGRTASGLSMLMNAASKVLQSVASNIDNDIIEPALEQLYQYLMLTDESGRMRGDEKIVVRGVGFAMQRETERMRALELLQLTNNPTDMQIVGMEGRAELLREVAERVGLDYARIVPDEEQMQQQQRMMEQQAAMQQAAAGMMAQTPSPANNTSDRVQANVAGMARGPSGQPT